MRLYKYLYLTILSRIQWIEIFLKILIEHKFTNFQQNTKCVFSDNPGQSCVSGN